MASDTRRTLWLSKEHRCPRNPTGHTPGPRPSLTSGPQRGRPGNVPGAAGTGAPRCPAGHPTRRQSGCPESGPVVTVGPARRGTPAGHSTRRQSGCPGNEKVGVPGRTRERQGGCPRNAAKGSRTDMVSNPGPTRTMWVSTERQNVAWYLTVGGRGQSGCPQKVRTKWVSSEGSQKVAESSAESSHGRPQGPPLHSEGGTPAHEVATRRKLVVGVGFVPARVANRTKYPNWAACAAPSSAGGLPAPRAAQSNRMPGGATRGHKGSLRPCARTPPRPVVASAAGRTVSHSRFAEGRARLAARRYKGSVCCGAVHTRLRAGSELPGPRPNCSQSGVGVRLRGAVLAGPMRARHLARAPARYGLCRLRPPRQLLPPFLSRQHAPGPRTD